MIETPVHRTAVYDSNTNQWYGGGGVGVGGRLTTYRGMWSQSQCMICNPGAYCPLGATENLTCPWGTYSNSSGASKCDLCPNGKYSGNYFEGRTTCIDCPRGAFCPEGSVREVAC